MAASNTCVNMFHQSILLSHQRDQLSLLSFYLLNAEISFSSGQRERNCERESDYFCPLHFILVSQPELLFFFFFLKRLLNMRPKIYLFSFQFCCSLHLNAQRTLEGVWYQSVVLTLGSLNSSPEMLLSQSEYS